MILGKLIVIKENLYGMVTNFLYTYSKTTKQALAWTRERTI
jgi:hypothetical protein